MSLTQSFYVGIFGMAVVFAALVWLMFIVQIQSKIYNAFSKPKKAENAPDISPKPAVNITAKPSTQLELINVDEKTAAMIIAIVSDESGIPPEQMDVKYIKALD